MREWVRRHWPAIALAVLAPAIAEVLSGSTKITLLFYAPPLFLLFFGGLMLMYGGGALLIREACVRWRKGWASVLLLGVAYGIMEEGIAVHTFFAPGGSPVGALGSFGRLGGVNWLWSVGLSSYHAVISIALPILLIELIYPSTRGVSFLSRRGTVAVGAGYLGIIGLFAAVTPFFPPTPLFVGSLVVVAALIAAARWAPRDLLRPRTGPTSAPWWAFAVVGSLLMVDWLVAGLSGPYVFRSAWLAGGAFVLGLVGILAFVLRYAGTVDDRLAKYWFAAGMIGFFFGWDAILEFVLVPGILLVSVAFGVFLYWLRRRIASADPPMPPSGALGVHPPPWTGEA